MARSPDSIGKASNDSNDCEMMRPAWAGEAGGGGGGGEIIVLLSR